MDSFVQTEFKAETQFVPIFAKMCSHGYQYVGFQI